MGTVLYQVTSESVDADHIRRRVDAWEERLQGLYTEIDDWFPDEWEERQGALVEMHEALMRKFGIGAKRIPTLELLNRAVDVVRVEPQTMWTIGANGQLVLRRDDHCYLIVDRTENFERPDWQSARADRRCDRETVTRDWLRRILQ